MPEIAWKSFGCSVRGASHIRLDKANQDSEYSHQGWVLSDGKIKIPSINAVSDGHGGDKYIRSAIGSDIATKLTGKIVEAYKENPLSPEMQKDDLADIIRHIKSRYLLSWQEEIDDHVKQNPFDDSELAFLKDNCSEKDCDSVINNPRSAYGCTFMCAICYDDIVLVLQLGDGDVLGLYPDDDVRELFEADPRNVGIETLSLGSLRNVSDITHKILIDEDIPRLITLTTDGVKNSYNDQTADIEKFLKIPIVIKNELVKNNLSTDEVKASIEKWLEKVTTDGAGDDVTIGVVFRDIESGA